MERPSTVPLLAVDPAFVRRKKIIRVVIAVVAVVAVIVIAVSIRSCVVSRGIRRALAEASELACQDTLESHARALEIVDELYDDYPDFPGVRARYAWQHAVVALQLGPVEPHLAALRAVAGGAPSPDEDPLLGASRAAGTLLGGDAAEAANQARAVLERAPTCRECGLVYARALIESGRANEAVPVLDRARLGRPPFVPALAELTTVMREVGMAGPARTAVDTLLKIAPGHRVGPIEDVLLRVEEASSLPEEERASAAAKLRPLLAKVTIAEEHQRRAALGRYAEGRLAYLAGDDEAAEAALAAALKLSPSDQRAAMWRAKALRRARRHTEAIESLAAYANDASALPGLLLTRAQLLLDLHKTTDAAAPIAALAAQKVKGASLLEGRRRFYAGDLHEAGAPLREALAEGYLEASLLLAEIAVARGHANELKTILGATFPPQLDGCAKGLRHYYRGATKNAAASFAAAAAAGGRCGRALAGRLLPGTGEDQRLHDELVKALHEREDLRDRVALGRLVFRLKGQAAAQAELDRVRELEPQGALVLSELGEAYAEIGQGATAAAVAREGMKRTKNAPRLVALAARLAREVRELDEASQLVEQGLSTTPNDPLLIVEKASILAARRRYPAAEELIEKALTPGAHFSAAACLRAEIQANRGDRRESQVQLARAIARNIRRVGFVGVAEARACLARSYIQRGRSSYGKARANLGLMRRRGLLWAEVPYLLGILDERLNKSQRAERNFRKALELDPAHFAAWQRLARRDALTDADRARFGELFPSKTLR